MSALSKIKLSIAYIWKKKWLVLGIGIIGLGIGIGIAESPAGVDSTKNQKTGPSAGVDSTKNQSTKGIGLRILKTLSSKLGIEKIFWLNIIIICSGLAIVIGLGGGLVKYLIFKRRTSWLFKYRTSWLWMVIVCIGVIIVGLGGGLVITDSLLLENISHIGILWLGRAIVFIGLLVAWFAKFKTRMIGRGIAIAGVLTSIVGIILTQVSGKELPGLLSFITYQLLPEISKIDDVLQDLVTHNSDNNAHLQAIRDSLTKSLKSQTDSLTKSLKSQTDSLTKAIEFQKASLTTTLKPQTAS